MYQNVSVTFHHWPQPLTCKHDVQPDELISSATNTVVSNCQSHTVIRQTTLNANVTYTVTLYPLSIHIPMLAGAPFQHKYSDAG